MISFILSSNSSFVDGKFEKVDIRSTKNSVPILDVVKDTTKTIVILLFYRTLIKMRGVIIFRFHRRSYILCFKIRSEVQFRGHGMFDPHVKSDGHQEEQVDTKKKRG